MRSLDQHPTGVELSDIINDLKNACEGTIEYNEFEAIMAKRFENSHSEKDILDAFKIFNKDGKGIISVNEIRHVLTTVGEKLTEEEVDQLIKDLKVDSDGLVKYVDFVNMLVPPKT